MGEESILKEFYPVPERILAKAWVKGRAEYDKLYAESIADPAAWWAKQADEILTFYKKWDKVMDYNFDIRKGPIYVKFFEGAKLNVSYNCLDRHLATKGDKVAIQWEGNEPGEQKAYTYKELMRKSASSPMS
jgi:acetyl-CoA synthetase